ncbi:Cell division control protein Cdc25 [Mycena sanguinolenta]|uniref:Cell division control protein Cdc25 n=1 Tax=Mycena sanguinolenta TaxID=230812 RepID=A0A8H7CQF0_9AGAR|nr:Cell division control protein Cdc25 [Mycena sanguinolenta]
MKISTHLRFASHYNMPLTAAERDRLRRLKLKLAAPAPAVATDISPAESVHSDEPEAPSSPLTLTVHATRHWLPLEQIFPSLVVPRRMLRELWHPKHLAEMKTLVPIFSSTLESALESIHCRQFLLRTDHVYNYVHAWVIYVVRTLVYHTENITHEDACRTAEDMEKALNIVEYAVKYLLMYQRTVEAFHRERIKALPDSPFDESEAPDFDAEVDHRIARAFDELEHDGATSRTDASRVIEDDEKSLPALPSEAGDLDDEKSLPDLPVEEPSFDGTKPLPDSPISNATESPLISSTPSNPIYKAPGDADVPKTRKHTFIHRILQMRAEFAKVKTRPNVLKRSPLAVLDLNISTDSLASHLRPEPRADVPYVVRQSFIYNRSDPLCPEQKVDMPLPTGDLVAIRLDANGDVKAASLPSLIQLLTSHHALPVDEMCETFFLSFRLFSSPTLFLAALLARWDEQPPVTGRPLTDAQQRVWVHHMCYVRNCLAQLLLTWLDEYWRPASDSVVLGPLRTFVTLRFDEAGLVPGITTLVLQAIDRAEQEEHTSRLQRAREAEHQGTPPQAGPLNIVIRPEDDYKLNISVFETNDGRARFAAQITAIAHGHFRALDPEAVVARWLTGELTFYAIQEFEEALLMWVAMSIVELQSREERVAMIEFWLDVACFCVNLRNFSSASAIFSGLVYSPVERLSLTILDIAVPSKEQYRQLNRLFNGANNYAVYRRVLATNNDPASSSAKDIISTKEVSGPMALTNDPDAEKTLINFSAYRMIEKTIRAMERCLVQYNIQSIRMIQDWIDKQLAVLPRAEHAAITERMNQMSEQLEGRAPPPIKKGETWLQTVKGSVASGDFVLCTLLDPGAVPTGPAKLRKNKSIVSILNLRIRAAK